jgi:type I restriction enzyme S subunit
MEGGYSLPDGWEWKTLPLMADIIMGQSPLAAPTNEDGRGLPFFQGKADFAHLHPSRGCGATAKESS